MASVTTASTRIYPALFIALALFFASAQLNPAQALAFNTPAGVINCDISDESLAVKVVYCVKMAVFSTTELFLIQTSALMAPVIDVMMILVLILLGVRIAAGERDPQKMVMSFLLRFGIVYLLADNFGAAMGGLTDDVFLIIEQLQAVAIPVLYVTSDTCDITSTSAPAGGYIIPITYTPWEYIDCIFDYIFGFGVDATIASSIFGFIGSTFFGGTVGMMAFVLGLATVLALAFFAFRVIYIVLVSYVYVGFLIVLTPLFAPLLMFKVTETAFRKWWGNLLGGIMLPFMMVAFLAFSMPILDTFVFGDDDQSLESTLGRGQEITEHYRLAAPVCEMTSASDFDFFDDLNSGRIVQNMFNPSESGAMDWCGMFDFTKVDLGEEHIQELWEIGMSLIRILGVVYLITAVAALLPNLTAFLLMSGFSLAQTAAAPILFETAIRRGFSSFTGMVHSASPGNLLSGTNNVGSLLRR